MRSPLPKPLVPIGGRAILLRLLDAVQAAGVTDIVVVVGHGADQVRAALPAGVRTALQPEQRGMAHAVACAREAIGEAREILIFVGDSPLLFSESVTALIAHHRGTGAAASFLTARFPRDFPYARVIFDAAGRVAGCVEARDASPEQHAIPYYMTSHYLFDAAALWRALPAIGPHGDTGELYLTDILDLLIAAGERVEAVEVDDWRQLVGPNTPEEVVWAEEVLLERGP